MAFASDASREYASTIQRLESNVLMTGSSWNDSQYLNCRDSLAEISRTISDVEFAASCCESAIAAFYNI